MRQLQSTWTVEYGVQSTTWAFWTNLVCTEGLQTVTVLRQVPRYHCRFYSSDTWTEGRVYKLEYESDLRSNEHDLSSSEKKAWKKFRPEFFFRPSFHYGLSRVHYCEDRFHIHVFNRSSNIWLSYIHSQYFKLFMFSWLSYSGCLCWEKAAMILL